MSARRSRSRGRSFARSSSPETKEDPHSLSNEGAVFKTRGAAKKVFKKLDTTKSGSLSKSDFVEGLLKILKKEEVTEQQLSALWEECDKDADNRLTWDAFCNKLSLNVSTFLRLKKAGVTKGSFVQKLSLTEMKTVLKSIYKGSVKQYKELSLSKAGDLNEPKLQKFINQILFFERQVAARAKRPPAPWAEITELVSDEDIAVLFKALDRKKEGKVDLSNFIPQMKAELQRKKPGANSKTEEKEDRRKRSRKKIKTRSQVDGEPYHMTTVKPAELLEFVNEAVLLALPSEYKCHPCLPSWGNAQVKAKGLSDSGYEVPVLVSNRTKVKYVTTLGGRPVIFATFRSELTSFATWESLYQCKIFLDTHEKVVDVDMRIVLVWCNGEENQLAKQKLFEDWYDIVPHRRD